MSMIFYVVICRSYILVTFDTDLWRGKLFE